MAKASKRNGKTRPKFEGDPETYIAPDRPEVLSARNGESAEVVDLSAGDTEVDLGAAGGDDNNAGDGAGADDAGGDTRRTEGDAGRSASTARGERDTHRGARGAAADEGEAADNDDARHSRKVRARIQRERANLNRERQLRQQTETTLAEERTARQALADRLERVERAQTEVAGNADVKSLEAQIQALVPQITAATEAGETAKALELQIKLGELQGDLRVLKYDLKKRQEAAAAAAEANRGRRSQQQADNGADPRAIDPVAKQTSNEFIRMNRHWWNRSKNKEAREDAVEIDKEVLTDLEAGELDFQPYSDEHFEEIAFRLHKTYPDLELCDLEGDPYIFGDDEDDDDMNDRDDRGRDRDRRDTRSDNRREARDERGRAPVGRGPGGIGRGGRRTPSPAELARQGKVTLEQADFNTMRTFGMDPNNQEHKKYFAKERQRSILTDDRRNGGGR